MKTNGKLNILITPFILALASCGNSPSNNQGLLSKMVDKIDGSASVNDSVTSLLQQQFAAVDTNDPAIKKSLSKNIHNNVGIAYKINHYQPLWFSDGKIKPAAANLLKAIDEALADGLLPEWYQAARLKKIADLQQQAGKPTAGMITDWDTTFSAAFITLYKDLQMGHLSPASVDSTWHAPNDSTFNGAQQLAAIAQQDEMPPLDDYRPNNVRYALFLKEAGLLQDLTRNEAFKEERKKVMNGDKAAARALIHFYVPDADDAAFTDSNGNSNPVMAYQYYHALPQTGRIDAKTLSALQVSPASYLKKVRINMERLRWLPRTNPDEYVWVTIPLMQYYYFRDGGVVLHNKSMIGKTSRQTPTIMANMANIVINPPWSVPPTILKKDILPGIEREGGAYIYRKGLKAYDHQGREVDASIINGGNYRNFRYTQPPGAHAALGAVKFNMPNPWNIYLHDTPHRGLFGADSRMESSGCVRVQDPIDFATEILGGRYTTEKIEDYISKGKTVYLPVKQSLPVFIVYMTIAADESLTHVQYISDMYGKDAKLRNRLYPETK